MRFYCVDTAEVMKAVNSSEEGLSSMEVSKRLEENGKNRLEAAKGKSVVQRFLEQLSDPMIIILLIAAAISGVLAVIENDSFADVIIILAVVIINAVLGVYQESKAEKAIEALQEISAATSKVLRDGKVQVIHSEDLVVGDVVLLEAGDAVPADARIIENASLKIEEAALTGESVPVTKFIELINLKEGEKDVPLGDRKNMMYMGSTVVYGRGKAVITATGMDTEMGKIADALTQAEEGQTPLQIKLSQLSGILTKLVLVICALVFVVQLVRAGGFDFELVLNSFMVAVSLAVAAIPEGLPAVLTLTLALGMSEMAKSKAIVRKLLSVETLGSCTVICSDKTGTLTENRMTVVESFYTNRDRTHLIGKLCNNASISHDTVIGDQTDGAILKHCRDYDCELERVYEIPLDSNRKMMTTIHRLDGENNIILSKSRFQRRNRNDMNPIFICVS